jgi:hypothetical protein
MSEHTIDSTINSKPMAEAGPKRTRKPPRSPKVLSWLDGVNEPEREAEEGSAAGALENVRSR